MSSFERWVSNFANHTLSDLNLFNFYLFVKSGLMPIKVKIRQLTQFLENFIFRNKKSYIYSHSFFVSLCEFYFILHCFCKQIC